MNQLFNTFKISLPLHYNFKYNDDPILYIYDGKRILGLYSFDRYKKVLYFKEINGNEKGYISLFEINYNGWFLITKDKAYQYAYNIDQDNVILPF